MAPQPEWMHQVLEENCTEKYCIEYLKDGNMLSNHITHAIIALTRLGADESFVRTFAKHYATRLERPPDGDLGGDDLSNADDILGKRVRFDEIRKHYEAVLADCGGRLMALVRRAFPPLAAGLYTSAVHGFIHLGYGLAADSARVTCEGLAYLHHSYVAVPLGLVGDDPNQPELRTLGKGTKGILEVLDELRTNVNLRDAVEAESRDPEKNRDRTRFQNAVGALFDYHSEDVLNYVHSIKFPDFWDPEKITPEQIKLISEWILDCAILIYVKSQRKNDFFLIHGVTSAWSLGRILPVLSRETEALRTLRILLCTVLGVYTAQGCPVLGEHVPVVDGSFPQIVAETLSEIRDEHIYKLVQVCLERSQQDEHAKEMCLNACHIALGNKLVF